MLVRKTILLTAPMVVALFASPLGWGQECQKIPRFEDYPVAALFKGKPAEPKLVTAQTKMFRTKIREGAKEAPNFAGHYTAFTVGCGSNCGTLYIVDAKTGRVFYPPGVDIIGSNQAGFGYDEQYRLDSRLMIGFRPRAAVAGDAADMPVPDDVLYYEWRKEELRLVCTKRTLAGR